MTLNPTSPLHVARRTCLVRLGFTLVEVMLVVVILAILGGAVLSQFQSSTTEARDAALTQSLRVLRVQIELFKAQHNGHPPGWTNPTDKTTALLHLLRPTDAAGNINGIASATFRYGPYLPIVAFDNPVNGNSEVKLSTHPHTESPDDNLTDDGEPVGWFYNPANGEVAGNCEGSTANGTPRIAL